MNMYERIQARKQAKHDKRMKTSKAYRDGYNAQQAGDARMLNPYFSHVAGITTASNNWEEGYSYAEREAK